MKNGVIMNHKTGTVSHIDPDSQFEFRCVSQSYMLQHGKILSLVCDASSAEVQLICYNHTNNSITVVATII